MKLKQLLILAFLFNQFIGNAQTNQKPFLEHFTNTNCSVCASKNPGFLSNYDKQSGLVRLTIFPSSPYASCLLSQQNKLDADARTKFYAIYGSTPRIVIQGKVVVSGVDITSNALFADYLGKTSPFKIRLEQKKYKSDSVKINVIIKMAGIHSFDSLNLFAGLAEDTVFYTGGNGEKLHFNVFRKGFNNSNGSTIKMPSKIGDSIMFSFSSKSNSVWKFDRIHGFAILQNKVNKEVIQAEEVSPKLNSSGSGSLKNLSKIEAQIFPNPASSILNVQLQNNNYSKVSLISMEGKIILSYHFNGSTQIDLNGLTKGIYIISIFNNEGVYNKKISIE